MSLGLKITWMGGISEVRNTTLKHWSHPFARFRGQVDQQRQNCFRSKVRESVTRLSEPLKKTPAYAEEPDGSGDCP